MGLGAGFAAYVTFTFILAVTPGAITAMVVRNTLRGGRAAGLACACGAAVANTVHAVLAGLGLSLLLARWPMALLSVRVLGAAYLAWLGVQSLWVAFRSADGGLRFVADVRRGGSADPPSGAGASNQPPPGLRRSAEALRAKAEDAPLRTGFREGLTLNIVNPAIISFYIAIVPTFIPAGAPRFYFVLLAATHVAIALTCHSMWAVALHAVRRWFAAPGARRALTAATGVALIVLAVRVLL